MIFYDLETELEISSTCYFHKTDHCCIHKSNCLCRPENEESVGFNPLESVLGAEKRFSAMIDIILDKKCGPLGTVIDYAVKK